MTLPKPPKQVYIYGVPLDTARLAAALGILATDVDTFQTEDERVVLKFKVTLTPAQETTLAKLMQPYSLIRKYQE